MPLNFSYVLTPLVTVNGTVTAPENGLKSMYLTFNEISDHQSINATVKGGSYSIVLKNQHSFMISIHYLSASNVKFVCNGGALSLSQTTESLQRDISCQGGVYEQ